MSDSPAAPSAAVVSKVKEFTNKWGIPLGGFGVGFLAGNAAGGQTMMALGGYNVANFFVTQMKLTERSAFLLTRLIYGGIFAAIGLSLSQIDGWPVRVVGWFLIGFGIAIIVRHFF